MSNVRAAIPAMEAYYADHDAYTGVSQVVLQTTYDQGLSPTVVANPNATGDKYCISATSGTFTAKVIGPGGTINVAPTGTGTGQIAACANGA